MEPVVTVVDRHPVAGADDPDQEEDDVERAAAEQVRPSSDRRGGHQDPDAEQRVDDVVEDADLEETEQLRVAEIARELQAVVEIGRDSGDEAGDPDKQKGDSRQPGDSLDRRGVVHSYLRTSSWCGRARFRVAPRSPAHVRASTPEARRLGGAGAGRPSGRARQPVSRAEPASRDG